MIDPTYEIHILNRQGQRYSGEYRWGDWQVLVVDVKARDLSDKLKFWRETAEYAIEHRGPSAMRKYRVREQLTHPPESE